MKLLLILSFASAVSVAMGHIASEDSRKLVFPDVPGFHTLKCDLHMHTVFSDGNVWPGIRVEEALRDGLDAIAITDHLEKLKHGKDIPMPDRNRSFEVARQAAEGSDLIVIRGTEITRSMPPGHGNAIFITDANAVKVEDPVESYRAAHSQGAFVFWNHPMWINQAADGIAKLSSMHRELIADGLLQGIEVVNDVTYSDEALQIALDNNLAIMGTSDIHGLIDWQYDVPNGGHRPLTLVLAREHSASGIRDALEERRTVAVIDDTLIGRPEQVVPVVNASLVAMSAEYRDKNNSSVAIVTFRNASSVSYILENVSDYNFQTHGDVIALPAMDDTAIQVKTLIRRTNFDLKFRALNVITAPGQHPEITIPVTVRVQ